MTQRIAITRLHYGLDYISSVIRSTEGYFDRHIVVYTENPNFPGTPTIPCPDSREELLQACYEAGGKRLHWIEGRIPAVAVAFDEYDDIELLMEFDGDEVGHQNLLADIIDRFEQGELTHQQYRIPFVHHWRSFRYACFDQQWPIRLYLPRAQNDGIGWYERIGWYVHHYGYARRNVDMRYKLDLSVHRPEFREEWWENKWMAFPNDLQDVHPVTIGLWDALPFDIGLHPAVMVNHPYRDLEVIE